ncbi:hypothetical protein BC832DRAFT_543069 [Gaertneriomyces semiglobifer]|nr:hypothetical protein BC832DRAFT_543069 [Gaertneriomyces semiglobifer]
MAPLPHIFTDNRLERTLVDLTLKLVNSVAAGDWATYSKLCSEDITSFEPEAGEHQVQGLDFHKFYFRLDAASSAPPAYDASGTTSTSSPPPPTTTIVSPHVRFLSHDRTSALVSYVRLVQRAVETDGAFVPTVRTSQETRVWELKNGEWKCVHFHRSIAAKEDPTMPLKDVRISAKL